MWINLFPAAQVISQYLSPHKIVLKLYLIFERDAKGLFGSYVETNEDYIITKNTTAGYFQAFY